jgi:hypothetical protein
MRGGVAGASVAGLALGASWGVACNLIAGNTPPVLVQPDGGDVGDASPQAPTPVKLAGNQPGPLAIALDEGGVYWSTSEVPPLDILRIGKDGTCPAGASQCPESLLAAVTAPRLDTTRALASDGVHLFWANYVWADSGATVYQLDRSSGTVLPLGASAQPDVLALAGSTLYWANAWDPSSVVRSPVGQVGAAARVAAASSNGAEEATSMVLAGSAVCWNSLANHAVYALPQGETCTESVDCPVLFDGGPDHVPFAIASDGSRVFVSNCALQGFPSGACSIVAVGGPDAGPPATLATNQPGVLAVVTDGAHVFWWSYGDDTIRSAAIGATAPCDATSCATIATTQGGVRLAADATGLYWISFNNGEVWKLAR